MDTGVHPERLARVLQDLVSRRFDATAPGVAIGVYLDGQLSASAYRGMACLEYDIPVGPETRFDIASVSKQITSACVWVLAREGILELDADLRHWIPELKLGGMTLRRCLQHTTGLRDYMTVNAIRGRSLADMPGQHEFISWMATVADTEFPPGSDISYSNTGYVLAATAVSRATGMPFADVLRRRIFAPLGMGDTTVHDRVGLVVPSMAFSYLADASGVVARVEMPEEQVGDGAVITTLGDLAAWHGFLVDGRGLGSDIHDGLTRAAVLLDGRTASYGCGVRLGEFAGMSMLQHSGHMYGYCSYLLCLPEAGIGVTVMSNLGSTPVSGLAHEVLEHVISRHPVTPSPRPVVEPPVGRWFSPTTIEIFDLEPDQAGRLQLSTPDGDDLLLAPAGERGWASPTHGVSVQMSSDTPCVQDWLGRLVDCVPVRPAPQVVPEPVTGVIEREDLGECWLRCDAEGMVLEIGRADPIHLEVVGMVDGDLLYLSRQSHLCLRYHVSTTQVSINVDRTTFAQLPLRAGSGPPAEDVR